MFCMFAKMLAAIQSIAARAGKHLQCFSKIFWVFPLSKSLCLWNSVYTRKTRWHTYTFSHLLELELFRLVCSKRRIPHVFLWNKWCKHNPEQDKAINCNRVIVCASVILSHLSVKLYNTAKLPHKIHCSRTVLMDNSWKHFKSALHCNIAELFSSFAKIYPFLL